MSIQAMTWAWSQVVGSPTRKLLLQCLANYADENGVCWPSQRRISADTELGESATRYALKRLETDGYLKRQPQTRKDGSRTSDRFTLQLVVQPKNSIKAGPSNSEGGTIKPRGGPPHKVKGVEPPREPLSKSSSLPSGATASGGGGGEFQKLWDQWPEKDRPDFREAAKTIFEKLLPADRTTAIAQAPAYLRNCAQQKSKALMIPYLKNRTFEELLDGPAIDADGHYRITPDRAEWSVWLASFGTESARKRIASNGYLLTKTRLPENQIDHRDSSS
jgi:hypothetical protein